jgi:FkbM family methyltransferase
MINSDALGNEFHRKLIQNYNWLLNLRPMQLAVYLVRLLAPDERRRISSTGMGIRLYLDAFSHLGQVVTRDNIYEPETVEIYRQNLKPGQVVLDIGTNEGVFASLAGKIVGDSGLVIAIEPQSRLRDIIEINFRINEVTNFKIYQSAFGKNESEKMSLNLYPALNNGASSLMTSNKLSSKTEEISFISTETILNECQISKIDFVKVDVEGFEHQVVKELLPYIKRGVICKLLLDYHTSILQSQNINPQHIHDSLIASGMRVNGGDDQTLSSYVMYEFVR